MTALLDLPTPAAVIDLDVLERNCARMSERMTSLGVRLRPHVKTHKCVEAARLQVRGHFGGIAVSTLAEARGFAAGGFTDITYAVPLAPARAAEALDLAGSLDALHLLVDSEDALDAIASHAPRTVSVFLKVDCGYGRAGVDPQGELGLALARRMTATDGIAFAGVLAHGGHAYAATDSDGVRAVADEERDVTAGFATRLRDAGIDVPVVSIGSTPTMCHAGDLTGVDETRPGNYALFDRFQAAIGSCDAADIAFSVLVSVIGAYPARDAAIVDGGALVFSKDRGATHVPGWSGGFGAPFGAPALELHDLSQEHGKLRSREGHVGAAGALRVGTKLRVLPNHSCLAAANFERIHVVRGDRVVDSWQPVRGW